jgi:hypothetical protein
MAQIKRLPETLKRNGVNYKMILRDEKVVLWELSIHKVIIGFEVSQIRILPEQKKFGKTFPARESLPPNSWFGVMDHSKCFFQDELERAKTYFEELSSMLKVERLVA